MPRKQVGAIDADLLAEVDKRAEYLGQTRRVFIERTLQERLANPDWKITTSAEFLVAHDNQINSHAGNIRASSQSKRDVHPRPKGER